MNKRMIRDLLQKLELETEEQKIIKQNFDTTSIADMTHNAALRPRIFS